VRAGLVGQWHSDQPGDGGLCKLNSTARLGLCVRGSVGACVHACVCSWLGALVRRALEGMGERWSSPFRTSGYGEPRDNWLQQTCHSGGEARHEGVLRWCECRVVWQTNGATPLLTASYNGHVKCVRVLLDRGAAINQATVGFASSMARHRGGCVCVGLRWSLRTRMTLQLVNCAGRARIGGYGRGAMERVPYFRSWGASR
jgi:hypothetical protein